MDYYDLFYKHKETKFCSSEASDVIYSIYYLNFWAPFP